MNQAKNDKKTENKDGYQSIHEKLKNLKVSEENREINILLLGETGVGKSTFINAFFNYITYPTFRDAQYKKLQCVIPSKFTVSDENFKEQVITLGKHHNESTKVGASATQACRSYIYFVKESNLKIRLIDTPGVGDTRGIDYDNINFENLLSYISELNYLNGICILLKPNNSRLTVMFEFCIKQLLTRLEKSASQNLMFVFTNTRSTFYRPGETLPSLRELLKSIKGVNITCEKPNIFCIDNESFRFLAAMQNKVRFSKSEVYNFAQSYQNSSDEYSRMIMYVVGNDECPGLIPHKVKNTISINEARRVIVQLSQPMAEIAQLIQDNIHTLEIHQKQINSSDTTLSELKSMLYIPIIDLDVIRLDRPNTVCTSLKCTTVYQVGNKTKWHYRQKCHAPCCLENVPNEIIGSPELTKCAAIDESGNCKICKCRYQVHMHIYYQTNTIETKIENETVKNSILNEEQTRKGAQELKLKMSKRSNTLNSEKDTITKITAKFACFLKTNAIAPYNDSYETYLKYLIDRENSRNDSANYDVINQLESMLKAYTEEKNTIMDAISRAPDGTAVITPDDVFNDIDSLYSLEIFGNKIKELFDTQKRGCENTIKRQCDYIFKPFVRTNNYTRGRGRGKPFCNDTQKQHVNKTTQGATSHGHQSQVPPLMSVETGINNSIESTSKNILPQPCDP
ncbi:hypothetical protein FQR65_LT00486 [Abscondita terminalis]|nr:hypothetical protein FQR65_LT00486 [Abscondita terminalis]